MKRQAGRWRWSLAIVSAALVVEAPGAAERSEAQRPVFRSGVELVEVDVVAVDGEGRPVRDLRREEFEVYEEGERRDIVSFVMVDGPPAEAGSPAWVDVSTNAGVERGRLLVVVLDDVNRSREATEAVRTTARELLARLGSTDRVAVVWTSLDKAGARELTTTHGALLEATEQFRGELRPIARRAASSLVGAPGAATEQVETGSGGGSSGPPDLKRFFDALRPFTIVADVSERLATLPHRRKAIVYIGEGLRPLGPEPMRTGTAEYAGLDLLRAVTAARRANVAVYLLDPRAPLRAGAEGLFEAWAAPDVARLRSGDWAAFTAATGGLAAVGPVTRAQIDRILSDTGTYYLLGYEAAPATRAGGVDRLRGLVDPWASFRRIAVRTTRPGVRVRARWGYVAEAPPERTRTRPAPDAASRVHEALSGLVPRGDLSLRAYAAAVRGRGSRHPVAIAVEVEDPALVAGAGERFADTVSLAVVAYEAGGAIRATERVKVAVGLGEGRAQGVAAGRYAVCVPVALPPGHYQVRIGVESMRANKTGSVYHDLTVPDFHRHPLTLSHIVLEQTAGGVQLPVARAGTIAALLPAMPALAREFRRSERATAWVRVYRTKAARDATVVLVATLTALGSGERVWTSRSGVDFSTADEATGPIELPLAELPEGRYELRVTAADTAGRWADERRLTMRVTAS